MNDESYMVNDMLFTAHHKLVFSALAQQWVLNSMVGGTTMETYFGEERVFVIVC